MQKILKKLKRKIREKFKHKCRRGHLKDEYWHSGIALWLRCEKCGKLWRQDIQTNKLTYDPDKDWEYMKYYK